MKHCKGITVIELLIILPLILVGVIGWGLNIYKLCSCDFKAPYRSEIIRGIGIGVAPVGCITGFMELPDIDALDNGA